MKFQFSHRAKIGQNYHSNHPYIESTTVLSDTSTRQTNNKIVNSPSNVRIMKWKIVK